MMEEMQSQKVVSAGGLNSNVNHIQLSDNEPGSAVELVNFEASLYGGYRRLSGFQPLDATAQEVDPAGAEGPILGIFFYEDNVIAARKQKSGNTYDFYTYTGSTWSKMTTSFSKSTVSLRRIRAREFNFNGTPKIVFADGINPGMIYDGTAWTQIKSTNSGANYAAAGGDQTINNPEYVEVFRNHIFFAKDHLVVHSAPLADFTWTVAAGAGQIPAGFLVNALKPFRDELYVMGVPQIKKISVNGTSFVLNDVATQIGCLAGDSVQEINGNLVFLSQDGFRPISGTDYIGDVNLETVSKKIQQLITDEVKGNDMYEVTSVLIRAKSQIRIFFSSASKSSDATFGIIGCLRANPDGSTSWEWGRIKGIRASCATSKYIGATEYIIHGDYNGKVYRQEQGNDFDGAAVQAIYITPYLDFGAPGVRKTMKKIRLFLRPEGAITITTRLTYDWSDVDKINPETYVFDGDVAGAIYGDAVYGAATYSSASTPVLIGGVEGSGFSVQMKYSTYDTSPPYTIQGALYDYNVDGRK
jgi:hypothetical protein